MRFGPVKTPKKTLAMGAFVASMVLVVAVAQEPGRKGVPDAAQVAEAWDLMREYRTAIYAPQSYKHDPATGLGVWAPPEIGPSLAVLVAANELEHADLVLPTVLRSGESVRHWLKWADRREEIWQMTSEADNGNPWGISGDQPLHLNIWYEAGIEGEIRQLIQELEALPK